MMFGVATSFLGGYALIRGRGRRRHVVTSALPVHVAGFAAATLLYTAYVGGSCLNQLCLSTFGVGGYDLTFLAVPTRGIHWLWDVLRLSVPGRSEQFFGDSSVWKTTFSLPLIVLGLVSWWRMKSGQTCTCLHPLGFAESLAGNGAVHQDRLHQAGTDGSIDARRVRRLPQQATPSCGSTFPVSTTCERCTVGARLWCFFLGVGGDSEWCAANRRTSSSWHWF